MVRSPVRPRELQDQPQEGRQPQTGISQAGSRPVVLAGPPLKAAQSPGRVPPGPGGHDFPAGRGGQDQGRHRQGPGQQYPGAQGISRDHGQQGTGPEGETPGQQQGQGGKIACDDGGSLGSHNKRTACSIYVITSGEVKVISGRPRWSRAPAREPGASGLPPKPNLGPDLVPVFEAGLPLPRAEGLEPLFPAFPAPRVDSKR